MVSPSECSSQIVHPHPATIFNCQPPAVPPPLDVVCLPAGGNWIASAQDMRGRVYIIDQAGDLYYDSGNPDIGIYAVRGGGD